MGAAHEAMADGGLSAEGMTLAQQKRFGVLIGSGSGGLEAIETSCRCALPQQSSRCCLAPPPRRLCPARAHRAHRFSKISYRLLCAIPTLALDSPPALLLSGH